MAAGSSTTIWCRTSSSALHQVLGFSYVPGTASVTFEFLIDFACIADVLINFRTGYEADGWVVSDPLSVARRYFQAILIRQSVEQV